MTTQLSFYTDREQSRPALYEVQREYQERRLFAYDPDRCITTSEDFLNYKCIPRDKPQDAIPRFGTPPIPVFDHDTGIEYQSLNQASIATGYTTMAIGHHINRRVAKVRFTRPGEKPPVVINPKNYVQVRHIPTGIIFKSVHSACKANKMNYKAIHKRASTPGAEWEYVK